MGFASLLGPGDTYSLLLLLPMDHTASHHYGKTPIMELSKHECWPFLLQAWCADSAFCKRECRRVEPSSQEKELCCMLVVPEQTCRIISARKHCRCRPSRPRVPKKSPKFLWTGKGGLCWALRGIQRSRPASPYVEEYLAQLCHLRISFWPLLARREEHSSQIPHWLPMVAYMS